MKWVFAGLSFAVLVGLAITTVAVRAANVAVRARLEVAARGLVVESVEHGRCRTMARGAGSPVALARCLRRWRRAQGAE